MISFFDKDPKYLLNQYCLVRVDYSFDINNLHTITLVRTTFIWKSERSMDSPRVVGDLKVLFVDLDIRGCPNHIIVSTQGIQKCPLL